MPDYALLISPAARGAYFGDTSKVVMAEIDGIREVDVHGIETRGGMDFVRVSADNKKVQNLLRLSFAQGLFQVEEGAWLPLEGSTEFHLHEDFVSGEKYRGKTNETLTQLLVNLALQEVRSGADSLRLLDPMCGRGTSLFWAMRYGMSATGVEQDPSALNEVRRGLKKWTKLHRQKHKLEEGWVQKANKKGVGKFLDFKADGQTVRIVTGDTVDVRSLVGQAPFDVLVTDIPYGVQHMGGVDGGRSPLAVIQKAAKGWAECLSPGGAMAIAFNRNIPKRAEMISAFDGLDIEVIDRDVAHRMSESIVRDVLLLRRTS